METQQQQSPFESLFESTSSYLDTRLELTKLKAVKKTSEIASTLVTKLVIGSVLFIFLLFFNIGVGFLLGDLMGKNYFGFFILALFYLIVGIIIYTIRHKWIKIPVANSIIKLVND